MTGSPSNNRDRIEILASSIGGAFFILYALQLIEDTLFLQPAVLQWMGVAGAVAVMLLLAAGVDRRLVLGAVLFTGSAFVRLSVPVSVSIIPTVFLAGSALVLVLVLLWRQFNTVGEWIMISGTIAGVFVEAFITGGLDKLVNGCILAGALMAFVFARWRIKRGEDAGSLYRRILVVTAVPCGAVFAGGMSGEPVYGYALIVATYAVFAISVLKKQMINWLDPFHREMKRNLVDFAGTLPAGTKLLDAGAGESQYADLFVHCETIGMDLAVGNQEWDYSGLDVVGDLHAIPLRNGSVDAVLCTVTLEHLHSPWQAMAEMGRVTRQGGKGFFVVPFMWELHQEPHDYYRYSPHGFRFLAERSGFGVDEVRPMGGLFRVLHYRFASLLKHAVRRPLLLLIMLPVIPLLMGYMLVSGIVDRLWKLCDHTLGYTIILTKRGEP